MKKSLIFTPGAIVLGVLMMSILLMTAVSCGKKESDLDKMIRIEDGVTIVRNPMEPVRVPGGPTGLVLEKNLRIGIGEGDENYMFAEVRAVQVDNQDNIYVLDTKLINIKVFDKEGRFVRMFLKTGQGPEEVGWPARMYMRDGNIIVILDSRNRKYLEFSTEGECLREIRLGDKGNIFRSWPDSIGNIYCETMDMAPEMMELKIVKYDSNFTQAEELVLVEYKRMMLEVSPVSVRLICSVRTDDHMMWANNMEYCLHVLDPSGKLVKKIYKDYEPPAFTAEEKEQTKKQYEEMGLPSTFKLVFPKEHPAINYLVSDDRGRTYVCTSGKNDDGFLKWDMFDEEGRYILSYYLAEDEYIFVIKEDQVYTICPEDEEGIPHMTRYTMNWQND